MHQIINTLLDPVVNFGKVTVSVGYTNLDTVIVLAAGHGSKLPNPSPDGQFNIVWHNSSKYADASDDPNVEIVRCTVRTGDVLTVVRGQEGTSASSKNSSGDTYNMMLSQTKKTISDIQTDAQSKVTAHAALTATHGVSGTIVGTTDTQTLSGKTLTSPTIGDFTYSTHAHTAAGSGGQISHLNLSNIGSNTHALIDTHVAASAAHNTAGNIVGTTDTQPLTNKTITDATNNVMAKSLKSATTVIDVSASAAPAIGNVLTATGSTTATWQAPTTGAIPTGGILPYAGTVAPSGFLLCDDSAISRTAYATLYSVVGTAYGAGDGSTTFNVPDFRGRDIVGSGTGTGLTARARGDKGGEETHVLTVAELALHTHSIGWVSGTQNVKSSGGGPNFDISGTSGATGSDTAHNNMQPYGVANYIIKT